MHSKIDGVATFGALLARVRAPSAGGRLFRDGLIEPEIFDAMVAADVRAWTEFLEMDEAALDAALGADDATAIDERTGRQTQGDSSSSKAPALRLVASTDYCAPPIWREHFRLRVAGIRDGLVAPRREVEREVKEIRRLLMSSQRSVLTDAFANLGGYVDDGRMLLVERVEHGVGTIEGCLGYDFVDLPHVPTGPGTPLVRRTIMRVRILGVRGDVDPNGLARRLWLEAQLVGAVRQVQDSGPDCFGMLCAADDRSDLLPSWIEGAGVHAWLVLSDAKVAVSDRTLLAFRDHIEPLRDADGMRVPYRLAVANRVQLLEAARLHRTGATPFDLRGEDGDVRFDYEVQDQLAGDVAAAVEALWEGVPDALRRFGLDGPADATVWGPPPAEEMSEPIGGYAPDARLAWEEARGGCSAR